MTNVPRLFAASPLTYLRLHFPYNRSQHPCGDINSFRHKFFKNYAINHRCWRERKFESGCFQASTQTSSKHRLLNAVEWLSMFCSFPAKLNAACFQRNVSWKLSGWKHCESQRELLIWILISQQKQKIHSHWAHHQKRGNQREVWNYHSCPPALMTTKRIIYL